MFQSLWRSVWWFLTKPNILLHPAIVHLGIYPRKTYIYTKAGTWMFMAALFETAKIWSNQDVFQ